MSRSRAALRLPVVLALALFLAWLGVGMAHQHAEDPTCQICKLLHSGAADVGRTASAPAPGTSYERVALTADLAPADHALPLPRGRSPPVV